VNLKADPAYHTVEVPPNARLALERRVQLVTGKGGVGRSTWASTLARVSAGRGSRTLIAEITEPGQAYSPLARLWGLDEFGFEPGVLEPGLMGVALSPRRGQEMFLSRVIHVEALARAALASEAIRKLLDVAPSFREMGVYYHLLMLLKAVHPAGGPLFERIIIDLPATGHTLALTGLPEILGRVITRGPIRDALLEGQQVLNSPELTAAWVVSLPEPLPVTESLELIEGLKRTRVPVGGVILNRLRQDPFSEQERSYIDGRLARGEGIPGYRAYIEIEENRAALARLDRSVGEPVIRASDLEDRVQSPFDVVSELVAQMLTVLKDAEGARA
jgi:arsenite-transporting ATPase